MSEDVKLPKVVQALLENYKEGELSLEELLAATYLKGVETQSFRLTEEDQNRVHAWQKEQDEKVAAKQGKKTPYYGAIGGAYVWMTCFTSLGSIETVKNSLTGEELRITNFEDS